MRLRVSMSRSGSYAVVVAATLLLFSLLIAGCSLGGDGTTTTVSSPGGGPDSTSTASTSSESTETTAGAVTSTTGIVISLPSTSSTEAETTTTTEALSSAETRLANGHIKAMGFIDKVWEKNGKRYIRIDYASMLTGDEAIEAAIADGVIEPGETLDNDYYISNVNPQKREFEVSDSVAITTSTRWVDGRRHERSLHLGRLQELLGSRPVPGDGGPSSCRAMVDRAGWGGGGEDRRTVSALVAARRLFDTRAACSRSARLPVPAALCGDSSLRQAG